MNRIILGLILNLFVTGAFSQINLNDFSTPPDSTKVLTWWHWMNGHVTESGISRDLETMHNVGLGGAIMFNIGFFPEGPVAFNSPKWWDMVKYSIQKCDSLGLKFGIFNSDGWSMSGGPWITTPESMKELTYSDTVIQGGKLFDGYLPRPYSTDTLYKIAIIAYPYTAGQDDFKPIKVKQGCSVVDYEFLIDDSKATQARFLNANDSVSCIKLQFNTIKTIQSLTVSNIKASNFLDALVYIKYSIDDKNYKRVAVNLPVNLKSEGINQGLTLSFAPINAKYIQLFVQFDKTAGSTAVSIGDVTFYRNRKVMLWEAKSGASKRIRHDRQLANNQEMNYWDGESNDEVSDIDQDQIINITDKIDLSGRLRWEVPEGRWMVIQVAYTSTLRQNSPSSVAGKGYECDKMDSLAVKKHFNSYVSKVNNLSLQTIGKPIDYMQMESWEAGIQNWTKDFEIKFENKTGYSIIPWLPVLTKGLVVNSYDESNRFLWDFRNVIAELIRENYWEVMYNLAHAKGISVLSEGSGMQHYLYDPMKYMQHSDIPMGEFWVNEGGVRADCKNAATMAHLNNQSVVAAEAFTAGGKNIWKTTPKDLKALGDQAFSIGVNQFVLHSYVHQPYEKAPGFTLNNWGSCFQRLNPWFPYVQGWMKYLQRCQYMLQQGELVTDVCYFIGEGIPAYLGLRNELSPSIPSGFDYDGIDSKNLQKLEVSSGKIKLPGGASWSVLVIRDYEKITPEILSKVIQLVEQGATVYMGKPLQSPSLINYKNSDTEIITIANKVWNNAADSIQPSLIRYGKGEIYFNYSLSDILSEKNLTPDFNYYVDDSVNELKYTHRKVANNDIYFISNNGKRQFSARLQFRQTDKEPIILNPVNGEHYSIPFVENKNSTEIELLFNQYDSYIVVFGDFKMVEKLQNYPTIDSVMFNTPWQLKFLNSDLPFNTELSKLTDWKESNDERIKFYSGVVEYSNTIEIKQKKQKQYVLSVDTICNVAEVYVNGSFVANLWHAPYSVDITNYLVPGKNQISIKVVNSIVNKMIGDNRYESDVEYEANHGVANIPGWLTNGSIERSTKRKTFVTYKYDYSINDMQPSGIIGNIKLLVKKAAK